MNSKIDSFFPTICILAGLILMLAGQIERGGYLILLGVGTLIFSSILIHATHKEAHHE